MKKIIILLCLTMTVLFSAPTYAQVKFGLKAGLNVTDMHLNPSLFDASNRTGWFAGPTVKVSLPLSGLGLDASALYDYRSAKVTDAIGEAETVKQSQIAIPVHLRYGVGLGSVASVFAFAGPQWGINVGDKNFKWTTGNSYSLRKSNFSVNVGLGASFISHLQVTANYNIACGKTADLNLGSIVNNTVKGKSRNNSWQVALAYFF